MPGPLSIFLSMKTPHYVDSISALHSTLGLKKPKHPLVSVVKLDDVVSELHRLEAFASYSYYCIALKMNFEGKMKYGQQYFDFNEGVMTFTAPRQVIQIETLSPVPVSGYLLMAHPDFFQSYPLATKIKEYGFFSYAVHEALHLSDTEEMMIADMMQDIDREIASPIDSFSQDVIVSHIDLLLNYANRFYNRQFITRKTANNDILIKLETLLEEYFNSDKIQQAGPPSVQYIAGQLHISPNYLSDMLRAHTGQNTKQHVQTKLLDKAKELLTTTSLSVAEIAYRLGFEFPQSFNKLFKSKTNVSPLEYRQSYQ
jgi:AraC-like DNA-binding protein